MSVLKQWEALPNRIFITLEYINSFGEKGVNRQDLKKQLQVNGHDAVVKTNLSEMEKMDFISKNQDE